jgi:hypothetical protein
MQLKSEMILMLTYTPWQRFQKDAIWRQMQEYKREKTSLEAKLKEMSKATAYHDDHLRIIDAWFNQVSILAHLPCSSGV